MKENKQALMKLFSLVLKDRAKEEKPTTTETTAPVSADTDKDAELTKWLSGKMLVSANTDPGI